jgi:molecular chaperone DnaJ
MLGKSITLDTIDGKTLEINIAPGIQPGQTLSIPGYGMPNMHDNRLKGRLLLNVNVTVPKFITDEQKQILEKLF